MRNRTAGSSLLVATATLAALGHAGPAAAADVLLDEELEPMNVIAVGLGGLWFVDEELRPVEGPSPAWSVRLGFEPIDMLAVEMSWTGNTSVERSVERLRLANLFEYDLRLNLTPALPLNPFVAAGVGFGSFFGAPQDTDLSMLTVPLAAGLEIRGDSFVVAGRATWRQAFFDRVTHSPIGADHVTATVELGQRF